MPSKTKISFNIDTFDKLIQDMGVDCWWSQAILCQCISADSGQPDFSCPYCGGSGYRYLPAMKIRCGVSSFSTRMTLESLGTRQPGTAYLTTPKEIIMGYRDRIIFKDFQCKYSQTIRFDYDRYGLFSTKLSKNIKKVLFLLVDDVLYEEHKDFMISDDCYHIKWNNMETLPDGKSASILFMTTPIYLVTDLLHELRATYTSHKSPVEVFTELPKQYLITREDFVYGVDQIKNEQPAPIEPAEPVEPEKPAEPELNLI